MFPQEQAASAYFSYLRDARERSARSQIRANWGAGGAPAAPIPEVPAPAPEAPVIRLELGAG